MESQGLMSENPLVQYKSAGFKTLTTSRMAGIENGHMSVARNRFKTALPKEPVPPMIRRVLFLNNDIFYSTSFAIFFVLTR